MTREFFRWKIRLDTLDLFDECLEGVVVADRELGENLAVELNLLGLQDSDEAAVARIESAKRVAESDDPEGTEGALLVPSVTIGVGTGFHDGLFGGGILSAAAPAVSLCRLEKVVASFACGHAALHTGHNVSWFTDEYSTMVRKIPLKVKVGFPFYA